MCSCGLPHPTSSASAALSRRAALRLLAGATLAPTLTGCDRIAPYLVSDATVEQLGLTLQKVTDQLREKYGLSDQVKGVVITKVAPNSPAAEKQLQAGDVILEVDQKPVTSPQVVADLVGKLQLAKKRSVLLFVERQGDPRFAALRLTK